ncbi:EamA-like transporter family protein [Pseudosulfitobacter pseudonitzschiae]|uniref:EamA-like transporter family protein n=1 Tax=Pseudosulfitobacter pseudonitzschiae TaxID=1402135 RepID=A0A221K0D2_9RHOB|nr:EamA-like transporter family protein [Pseudosulfitobacter pseudonitzschiae]
MTTLRVCVLRGLPSLADSDGDAARTRLIGVIFGLSAVVMWALYFVYAREAAQTGLLPIDVILLRYGVAGLILLPWLVRKGLGNLGGVGWGRGVVVAIVVGPLFLMFGAGGFLFAPLAHGAVIQPSTAALVATGVAILFLGEKLHAARIAGIAMVLGGIALISMTGTTASAPDAWKGHLMFMAAGGCWAAFTILLRLWQLGAIAATAAASVLSAAVVVPGVLMFGTLDRLAALPVDKLVVQIVVHGGMAGVLAMVAYARSVALLGVGLAALFPAVVPAVALILGIPLAGEVPTAPEWLGAVLATTGLAVALGGIPGLRRVGA